MHRRRFVSLRGAVILLAAAALFLPVNVSRALAPVSFTWLGKLSGDDYSMVQGVSADGSVVVGSSYLTGSGPLPTIHAFRWTAGGGLVGIGDLPGGNVLSEAYGTSANGSVIVGRSSSTLSYSGNPFYDEPFRWTSSGMQGLGFLSNYASSYGDAHAVSADGSVVVGTSVAANGAERPFRWTQGGGMVNLGTLTNYAGGNQNGAYAVSADGSVVAGMSTTETGRTAFRWTQANGMQSLGTLPGAGSQGGELYSAALGISADGSTIVGSGYSSNGIEAFRWTSGGGIVGLGDLPGGAFSSDALDASANGSIIVGQGTPASGGEAVRWDPVQGMKTIRELLVAGGVVFTPGWRLTVATAVSDDGTVIVGYGDGPGGVTQGWIAIIPVPEPSTLALGVATLFICGLRSRARSSAPAKFSSPC